MAEAGAVAYSRTVVATNSSMHRHQAKGGYGC